MGDVAIRFPGQQRDSSFRSGLLVWEDCQLSSQLLVLLNTHAWKSLAKTSLGLAGAAAARMFGTVYTWALLSQASVNSR